MGERRRAVAVCVHLLRHRLISTGGWRHRCALPSVVTVELLLTIAHGPARYALITGCTDCGEVTR